MQKRMVPGLDAEVSLLGLSTDYAERELYRFAFEGGVNFFALPFTDDCGQEALFGNTMKEYKREDFFVMSYLPLGRAEAAEQAERLFDRQYSRLLANPSNSPVQAMMAPAHRNSQSGFCKKSNALSPGTLDFYCLDIACDEQIGILEESGIYDALLSKKAEGKLKFLGFSYSGSPQGMLKLAKMHKWDFAQTDINYYDWEANKAHDRYEILSDMGIPCIARSPFCSGRLAGLPAPVNAVFKAEDRQSSVALWALRYVLSLPNVMTVIPTVANLEQLNDNIGSVSRFKPLEAFEYQAILRALSLMKMIYSQST